jgi:hypothetical protein
MQGGRSQRPGFHRPVGPSRVKVRRRLASAQSEPLGLQSRLGHLAPPQPPLGDPLEPSPLEVGGFHAPLGWAFQEQPLEHAPRDPDHPAVLADLDPELHGRPLASRRASSGTTVGKQHPFAVSYPEVRADKERAPREGQVG